MLPSLQVFAVHFSISLTKVQTWVAWMIVRSLILLKPAPIFDLKP